MTINSVELNSSAATAENIAPSTVAPRVNKPSAKYRQRFKLIAFTNPRSGSKSWRVSGIKRDGSRIRENYAELQAAECRHVELTNEWLSRQTETVVRATKLTDDQIHRAGNAFRRLESDDELTQAIDYWLKHGKKLAVPDSVSLQDAYKKYGEWLDSKECPLREKTKENIRTKARIFVDGTPNVRICDVTPDNIEHFLSRRNVSSITRHADKRGISRFFTWCIERPRRWATMNPAHEVRVHKGEQAPPEVLPVKECADLLEAAEAHEKGVLVPYVAVCLFAGLRPNEAMRLQWSQVNLADKEIRLEGKQTKTGRPRVVTICPTLHAWLKAYENKPFWPKDLSYDFRKVRAAAKIKKWPNDVMRHTAISHYFRQTGSYGQTAEQFGNSEAIIKAHYQARVSSEDTRKFFALKPTTKKSQGKAA